MTTVTIRPTGADMSTVAKELVALAGGDASQVRAATAGLTVSPELAYLWLARSLNGHAPALPTAAVSTVAATDTRVPRADGTRARTRKPKTSATEE